MSSDNLPKFSAINRASYVSIGLMVTFCAGMFWIGTTTATISARMEDLPMIKQDIRVMKEILGKSNGVQLQQHAEIEALKERVKSLESKPIPPEWFRAQVEKHEKSLDEVKRRIEALERK